MPNPVSDVFPLADEREKKRRPQLIAHLWWDYVPRSFVEPHEYLQRDPAFRSVNLVSQLWDNGKAPDQDTHFVHRRAAKNLVNPSLPYRLISRITRSRRWSKFRQFVRRESLRRQPSLFHSHFGTTGCELASDLSEYRAPHVVTLYGYDGSAALLSKHLRAKYAVMYRTVARIIVLCEAVKTRLIKDGCPPEKIAVWNLPAGVEKYPLVSRPAPGKTLRIVMAARFVEAKGHVFLLRAMARLKERGHAVQATLLGYGNRVDLVRAEVARLDLAGEVTILDNNLAGDFAETYRELLARSDLYVLPSVRDRHGTDEAGPALTMVCAQASGLPVVCTPFPGSEISMVDGETGFFCAENDECSLADHIEFFIRNPAARAEFGRRGSQIANEEFSEWLQIERLWAIYEEAIEGYRAPANYASRPQVASPFPEDPAVPRHAPTGIGHEKEGR